MTQQIITKESDILNFGKHKGQSIAMVLIDDPQYILWLYEKDIVKFPEDLVIRAEEYDEENKLEQATNDIFDY